MTVTVKSKAPVGVQSRVRRRADSKTSGEIQIPKSIVKAEYGADEYTPAQRRAILREIQKGLAEIEAGRFYGPFETVAELRACVEAGVRRPPAARTRAQEKRKKRK
jgi:hypothetical protein